jgi:hypothetical protein
MVCGFLCTSSTELIIIIIIIIIIVKQLDHLPNCSGLVCTVSSSKVLHGSMVSAVSKFLTVSEFYFLAFRRLLNPTGFVLYVYYMWILVVDVYGCETWSLKVREEHRLMVFQSRVLRRIFVPKTDEVIGCWGKLHNEELHKLYSSPSIIRMIKSRRMRWTGHIARMGKGGMYTGFW